MHESMYQGVVGLLEILVAAYDPGEREPPCNNNNNNIHIFSQRQNNWLLAQQMPSPMVVESARKYTNQENRR